MEDPVATNRRTNRGDGQQASGRARRRAGNQAVHYAAKAAAARTPVERTTVAFDQWRSLVRDLPDGQAARLADQLTTLINHQITHMAPKE
jgi:hypothetical protein